MNWITDQATAPPASTSPAHRLATDPAGEPRVIDLTSAGGFADGRSPIKEGPAVEAFRLIARQVHHQLGGTPSSLAIIDADGDGRRRVRAELLARALSELRPPVGVIDLPPGDRMRPPTLHGSGFSWLTLPAPVEPHPQSMVDALLGLLEIEFEENRTVLVCTRSTPSSLAFAVAEVVDAVLYVVRPGSRRSGVHAQVRSNLDRLDARVLGIVVDEA